MGVEVRSAPRAARPATLSSEHLGPDFVVPLERAGAAGVALVGAKAANLGRAMDAGLPVLPGFVLSTEAVRLLGAGPGFDGSRRVREELAVAWAMLSDNGRRALVVRSSSPVEDQASSSMAGLFSSVVGVGDWFAFLTAVHTVVGSADPHGNEPGTAAPMAVLVQPHLEPELAGVLFGVDPLTGRTDRRVVAAVEGGPQALVSGEVDGTRYLIGPRGRLFDVAGPRLALRRGHRRALAALARRAAAVFGGPQDMEWALAAGGRLWLLQARPVTAVATAASGSVFGPGPLAETFPDPLERLQEDLWLPPLRRAMAESIRLTGSASRRRLSASPLVVAVAGRVAADLALLGADPTPPSLWSRLDPRPSLRRLRMAWTVGRLRAALPALAGDVTTAVDEELAAVPALGRLDDARLLMLMHRAYESLTSVHGYEMLAGLVAPQPLTAASVALDALAAGRAAGMEDEDIVVAWPEVLVLTPPGLTTPPLPPTGFVRATAPARKRIDALGPREALRLRARWLHELTMRAARELGIRLCARGVLADPDDVGLLTLAELEVAVADGTVPAALDARRVQSSPPLPAAFQLAGDRPVSVGAARGKQPTPGQGASPGRAVGPAHHGPPPGPPGSVLVVATLDPGLASQLSQVAGLVAETGNVLSHLAILAREFGVPCVVGHSGAREQFPPGTVLLVDGTTGEVARCEDGSR